MIILLSAGHSDLIPRVFSKGSRSSQAMSIKAVKEAEDINTVTELKNSTDDGGVSTYYQCNNRTKEGILSLWLESVAKSFHNHLEIAVIRLRSKVFLHISVCYGCI